MVSADFDQILEEIGPFGRYQAYNIVLTGLPGLIVGAICMANVFLAGLPDYHCSTSNLTLHGNTEVYDDACYYTTENGTVSEECRDWQFDQSQLGHTMASEWGLVCGREWMLALSQSTFMLGFLIGCVSLGNLSDILGRKLVFFLGLILMIVSGSAAAFMPNYWLFISLRLVMGAASAGLFTAGFVITMETVGTAHRMTPGVLYQAWPALGYMLLALVAYFIRDFRYLQLFLGLISIVFLPYWCLLGESPRWLLAEGRTKQAVKEIQRAARMNRKPVPESILATETKTLLNGKETQSGREAASSEGSKTYTVLDLFKTPNMRRKTLNSYVSWFVNSLVYYGLSLGVGELAGGPYLNLFLSGLMEFPGYLIAILTLDRFGRRFPLAGLMLIGGLACLGTAAIPSEYPIAITTLAMIGKLGISGSFSVIYVFSAELFPTVVRNLGVGSGSMCARVGSLTAPFILMLKLWWPPLPMLVFGAASVLAGMLAVTLPETLNEKLPETLEDGENFGKDAHKQIFSVLKSRKGEPVKKSEENGDIAECPTNGSCEAV